jgi:hypothetical protein
MMYAIRKKQSERKKRREAREGGRKGRIRNGERRCCGLNVCPLQNSC